MSRRNNSIQNMGANRMQRSGPRRMQWLDIAKGFGIIIVMIIHSIMPVVNAISTHLSSFVIPLFFFMAGITYNNEKHRGRLTRFAKTRGKRFLIPYFIIYIFVLLVLVPASIFVELPITANELFFWFIYGAGPPYMALHIWFLPVLFFGLLLFAVGDRIANGNEFALFGIFVLLMPLAAYFLWIMFQPVLIPWHLSSIMLASIFVYVGNTFRYKRGLTPLTKDNTILDILAVVILSAITLLVSQLNGYVDMAMDNYGVSPFLYLITGITGSILILVLSHLMTKSSHASRFMLAYGSQSQEIYESHPAGFPLTAGLFILLGFSIADLANLHLVLWPARFIAAMLVGYYFVKYGVNRSRVLSFIFRGVAKTEAGRKTSKLPGSEKPTELPYSKHSES
ncbi:MAG: acyltransferase family protein [Candidatus Lokiarchaeota archaeon]|nr:acyltransferase family protein [Candidatus Lokiarchaeota archaeon]